MPATVFTLVELFARVVRPEVPASVVVAGRYSCNCIDVRIISSNSIYIRRVRVYCIDVRNISVNSC